MTLGQQATRETYSRQKHRVVGAPLKRPPYRMVRCRDDLVRLFMEALTNSAFKGVYNATAPNPVRMSELCASLGTVLGRPSWLPVPDFAIQAQSQPQHQSPILSHLCGHLPATHVHCRLFLVKGLGSCWRGRRCSLQRQRRQGTSFSFQTWVQQCAMFCAELDCSLRRFCTCVNLWWSTGCCIMLHSLRALTTIACQSRTNTVNQAAVNGKSLRQPKISHLYQVLVLAAVS